MRITGYKDTLVLFICTKIRSKSSMYPDKVQLPRFAMRSRSGLSCVIYVAGHLSLESITSRQSLPILVHISWHALQFAHSDSNASSSPP